MCEISPLDNERFDELGGYFNTVGSKIFRLHHMIFRSFTVEGFAKH